MGKVEEGKVRKREKERSAGYCGHQTLLREVYLESKPKEGALRKQENAEEKP